MNKDKLHQWFTEHNVKSISPNITLFLLEIVKDLKPKIITVKNDNELYTDLEAYKDALVTVCRIAAVHQKAVIDKLEVLVKGRKEEANALRDRSSDG